HFAPSASVLPDRRWLGLQIDHRQFLDALQDDWLRPATDRHGRMLRVDGYSEDEEPSKKTGNLISVSLCFDIRLLPNLTVLIWCAGVWKEARPDLIPSNVEFVFWPGAIPLFAVSRIYVKTTEE